MKYCWVPSSFLEDLPSPNCVIGGYDKENNPLYVGRVFHAGEAICTWINLNKKLCSVPYDNEVHEKTDFEYLVSDQVKWVYATNGDIPKNAIQTGYTMTSEPLYVARVNNDLKTIPGNIKAECRGSFIAIDGKEKFSPQYEVLVWDPLLVKPNELETIELDDNPLNKEEVITTTRTCRMFCGDLCQIIFGKTNQEP
ncbi:hypothetical protein PVAND_017842 [Polypedilum vanderplanki]|uniref:Uncharacterized protein n=1 Tax=Polypedilum vanderplanki TaxID=319348 RepID=A0A9J6B9U8_POLVA|nr:hypothetical protein PVAND_017842 [Polypedilum vanderplanki]